jgi:hypothetical protein
MAGGDSGEKEKTKVTCHQEQLYRWESRHNNTDKPVATVATPQSAGTDRFKETRV